MQCRVVIDPRCDIDVGDRTPDRRLLAARYIRLILDLLGRHAGHPPGSYHDPAQAPNHYVWEDANWRVVYRIDEARRLLVFKRRTVIVLAAWLREDAGDSPIPEPSRYGR